MNFQILLISFQIQKREVLYFSKVKFETVKFEMKKKNESKRKHWIPEFFHKQEEKRPFNNLTIKLANKKSFLVKV